MQRVTLDLKKSYTVIDDGDGGSECHYYYMWKRNIWEAGDRKLPWCHRKALTQSPPFLNVIVIIRSKVYARWKWPSFRRHLKYSSQFHGIRVFFGRQRECRFYTAGCGNRMAVSVTGPCAVNELGGPVIPGNRKYENKKIGSYLCLFYY